MRVVFGEEKRLGHLGSTWKCVGQDLVVELLEHGSNLAFGHHVPVKLVGGIGEVLLQQFQALGACQLVALINIDPG